MAALARPVRSVEKSALHFIEGLLHLAFDMAEMTSRTDIIGILTDS